MDELIESNEIMEDWRALRARLRRDGYVFLRGLVDPRLATQAGRDALSGLVATGWADESGRPNGAVHPPDRADPGYRAFALAERVNQLPYESGPQRLMALLAGSGAFVYPVKVPRAVYPDRLNPHHKGRFVHQDYRVMG